MKRGWAFGAAIASVACGGVQDPARQLNSSIVANAPDQCTPVKIDRVTQPVRPKVDVLWVLQNSGSLDEEHNLLKINITHFLPHLRDSGVDWRMGLITTDTNDEELAGALVTIPGYDFVTGDDSLAAEIFGDIVSTVGLGGAAQSRGLRAVDRFLDRQVGGEGSFYRDDASLYVVFISAKHDESEGEPTLQQLIGRLSRLKSSPDMVTVSTIVGDAPDGCGGPIGAANSGEEYIALTTHFGGIHHGICFEGYDASMDRMGRQAGEVIVEYPLSEIPVPGTLSISLVGLEESGDSRVIFGVDKSTVPEGQTVQDVCEAEGCVGYSFIPERNSVVIKWEVPTEVEYLEAEYKLLSEWEPDGCEEEEGLALE